MSEDAELAEALYQSRLVLEGLGGRQKENVVIARDHARSCHDAIQALLRVRGHDPGSTSTDADDLKLALIGTKSAQEVRPTARERDSILDALLEAAESDGSELFLHRTVGRWAAFFARAVLAHDEVVRGAMKDDPLLPVRPWIKERGIDTGDLVAMARAYAEWTKEANDIFSRRRFGG
jgi:hypothetical protein